MRDLIKPLGSALGTIFAAAWCQGLPLLLSALSAAGLGFMIDDAVLIRLLIAFVALNLWLRWRTTGRHANRRPLGLGVVAGAISVVDLYLHSAGVMFGLLMLVAASVWDFVSGRRTPQCAT